MRELVITVPMIPVPLYHVLTPSGCPQWFETNNVHVQLHQRMVTMLGNAMTRKTLVGAVACASLLVGVRVAAQRTMSAVGLPAPSGTNKVGTQILYLYDGSRHGRALDTAGTRSITAQVWYPTDGHSKGRKAYLPDARLLAALEHPPYLKLSVSVLDDWAAMRTHAIPDAPIRGNAGHMPIVFFSPGFGLSRVSYTALSEDLASHGYIVVTMDHPFTGVTIDAVGNRLDIEKEPQGPNYAAQRVLDMSSDAAFVLRVLMSTSTEPSQFATSIDTGRVSMIGHSLGGAAALEACRSHPLFRACVDIDGYPFGPAEEAGVTKPFMVVLNEPDAQHRPSPAMQKERYDDWVTRIRKQKSPAFLYTMHNTAHMSFTDMPFVSPHAFLAAEGGTRSPDATLKALSAGVRTFLQQYAGDGRADVRDLAVRFTDVSIEAFNVDH